MPAVPQTLPPSICRGVSLPSAVLSGKSQVFLLRRGPPKQNCTPSRLCFLVRTRVAPTVGQKDWFLKPALTVGLSFSPLPVPPPLNQPHLPTLLWMEFFSGVRNIPRSGPWAVWLWAFVDVTGARVSPLTGRAHGARCVCCDAYHYPPARRAGRDARQHRSTWNPWDQDQRQDRILRSSLFPSTGCAREQAQSLL